MKDSLHSRLLAEFNDPDLNKRVCAYTQAYLTNALERHVKPTQAALAGLGNFDEALPEVGQAAEEVLELLHQYGGPATMPSVGGRYFGFVTGSSIPAARAAKQLATAWDQNCAMQVLSPICSKLEAVVERWVVELLGLSGEVIAGFVSGTSTANFCGLAAARYRLLERHGWDINKDGLFGAPEIRVVTGEHAHSTVLKAIALLGFGQDNIEWVEVDGQGRIIPEAIPQLDEHTILILQAGNVNSGSFDDFEQIQTMVADSGAWVHVDGAFGLWAAASSELNHLTAGMGFADSWAVDAHKTINTPYDCGIVLCADQDALVSALHMQGGYIILGDRDGMFYTPEMSRRGRIIELWATLKSLGRQGVDALVTQLHQRALQFAEEVARLEGFAVVNEIVFNQVLVQCGDDELTEQVIDRIQEIRECWVGGSRWFGRKVIRVSICAWTTTAEDISRSVRSFEQAIKEVVAHD